MSKRTRAAHVLDLTGVGSLLRRVGAWRGVLVFNYHRIGDSSASLLDRNLWSASADDFDDQVGFLAREFEILDLADLGPDHLRERGRHVVITFDDGYRDNYTAAYPVLRSHGAKATFFLTTGFLDGQATAWWDEIAWLVRTSPRRQVVLPTWGELEVDLDEPGRQGAVTKLRSACGSLPGRRVGQFLDDLAHATGVPRRSAQEAREDWMTWEMVREMHAAGMGIGAHTVTHPVLSSVSDEDQRAEIGLSLDRLERQTGTRPTLFSYPIGQPASFTARTKAHVRESGVRLAFSNYGGFPSTGNWDPYDVRRSNLMEDDAIELFRAMATLPRQFARW